MTLLLEVSGARVRLWKGLATCSGESGGVLNSDPIAIETIEIPMSLSEPSHSAEHVGQHMVSRGSLAVLSCERPDKPGAPRQSPTMSMITVKAQTLV